MTSTDSGGGASALNLPPATHEAKPADGPLVRSATQLEPGTAMTFRARLVVAALVYATLILALVGFVLDLDPLRATAVSLFLLVEVGAAPVLLLKPLSPLWFTLISVTTSLVTTVLVGIAMAVLHLWHPIGMFGALAAVAVALLAIAVARDWKQLSVDRP